MLTYRLFYYTLASLAYSSWAEITFDNRTPGCTEPFTAGMMYGALSENVSCNDTRFIKSWDYVRRESQFTHRDVRGMAKQVRSGVIYWFIVEVPGIDKFNRKLEDVIYNADDEVSNWENSDQTSDLWDDEEGQDIDDEDFSASTIEQGGKPDDEFFKTCCRLPIRISVFNPVPALAKGHACCSPGPCKPHTRPCLLS